MNSKDDILGEVILDMLSQFLFLPSSDQAKTDLEMICLTCGECVCDVAAGCDLGDLAATAAYHQHIFPATRVLVRRQGGCRLGPGHRCCHRLHRRAGGDCGFGQRCPDGGPASAGLPNRRDLAARTTRKQFSLEGRLMARNRAAVAASPYVARTERR